MAFQPGLNILEQCQISPPAGSVSLSSLPLTIFDLLWLPVETPVQRLLFFENHCSKDHFANTILPNIKHSLSLALHHFFPLAGDSVPFTFAESDLDFDVLVRYDATDICAFYPLVPQLINSPSENRFPLIAFSITFFPDKGISIGLTFNHVAADGRAIHHFIKAWASICQNIQKTSSSMIHVPPPCISRSLIKEDPKNETDSAVSYYLRKANMLRDTFYTSNHHSIGTDKVVATFVMRRADINKIRQWIMANKKGNAPVFQYSTFVLACAYAWVCLMKAQSRESVAVESGEDQMRYLLFSMDYRARLDPSLPVTYFGNCILPIIVGSKLNDLLGELEVPIAADLIQHAIREIGDGNAIVKQMHWYLYNFTLPEHILPVGGSPKFGIYDSDFGWGKPKRTHVISSGALYLSECPSEVGAVEIGFARDKVEMNAFAYFYTSSMQVFPTCI